MKKSPELFRQKYCQMSFLYAGMVCEYTSWYQSQPAPGSHSISTGGRKLGYSSSGSEFGLLYGVSKVASSTSPTDDAKMTALRRTACHSLENSLIGATLDILLKQKIGAVRLCLHNKNGGGGGRAEQQVNTNKLVIPKFK